MIKKIEITIKRLLYFWCLSFVIATSCYYLLWAIMPMHYVFGTWPRMFLYHYQYPVLYITIPCFFYGIVATYYSNKFCAQSSKQQILTTISIAALTILISMPFGGMLWVYHDMQAGYFPANCTNRIISNGISMGLSTGWLIILVSIPYNILGLITSYFITKFGANQFRIKK
jgi:hypothetical protein